MEVLQRGAYSAHGNDPRRGMTQSALGEVRNAPNPGRDLGGTSKGEYCHLW